MYFHTGIKDYVLFKQWVPTSDGYYVGTWIAVFLFGVFYEALKVLRTRLEKKWQAQFEAQSESQYLLNPSFFAPQQPFRLSVDLMRGIMHTVEVGWGLLIMLVAMTYNVGLFFGVLAGAFVGSVALGRFTHYVPKSSCH
jgi:copper transporter 1